MISKKAYINTREVILGHKNPNPEMEKLISWMNENYNVNVKNIFYSTTFRSKIPTLEVCLEFKNELSVFLDETKLSFDPIIQKNTINQFVEILIYENLHKKYAHLFQYYLDAENKITDFYVKFCAFAPKARAEANQNIPNEELEALKNKVGNDILWEISRHLDHATFFVYSNEQIEKYKNSESLKKWTEMYFYLLKEHDEFNYFEKNKFSMNIESKENFEQFYQNSWHYYYR